MFWWDSNPRQQTPKEVNPISCQLFSIFRLSHHNLMILYIAVSSFHFYSCKNFNRKENGERILLFNITLLNWVIPVCYAIFIHDLVVYKPSQLPAFRKKESLALFKYICYHYISPCIISISAIYNPSIFYTFA